MGQASEHGMILVIASQGFSAEIMEATKEVGAAGGTVVYATDSEPENLETFSGMTLKPEKELILTLTQQSLRKGTMQVVMKMHGSGTDTGAFVFSSPVDQVIGLTSQENRKDCNV